MGSVNLERGLRRQHEAVAERRARAPAPIGSGAGHTPKLREAQLHSGVGDELSRRCEEDAKRS